HITRNYAPLKVRFEICDLDDPGVKAGEVEKALYSYVRSTAPSERTATNQIRYWYDAARSDRGGLSFYAFRINSIIRGFAEIRHIASSNTVVLDYVCIDPEFETNAGYFVFLELLCKEIDEKLAPFYVATEVVLNIDRKSKDEANKYWLRVLELVGFKVVQREYFHPSLEPEDPDQTRAGILMIRSNEPSAQLSSSAYLQIVKAIYLDHYLPWYAPFSPNIAKYEEFLKAKILKLQSDLGATKLVKLNGSLKHAGLVENELEPPLTERPSYYFLFFSIVATIVLAGTISAVAVLTSLGPYAAIGIFLMAVLIFAGLVAVFIPSRISVFSGIGDVIIRLLSQPK
ncbi:hypothetical protein C8J35_1682, partial [Rhizobium sp. PP-F2F-G38]